MLTKLIRLYLKHFYQKEAPKKLDNILVLSNTAIGDTLFSTPVFRAIKKYLPNSKLVAILNPKNAELFNTNPYIDEVLLYRGRWSGFFGILKEIKKRGFDVAIVLHSNEPQATPLCALAGIKTIIKLPNDKNEFNFVHFNPIASLIPDKHICFDKLKALEFIGIYESDIRMELFLKDEWQKSVDAFLDKLELLPKKGSFIGFQIGSANLSRQWFKERWIELGELILKTHQEITIFLLGSLDESKLTAPIKSAINSNRVIDVAGRFKLGEVAALISKLDLLVTVDTGPLHIATALGVPTISLFVAGDPVKFNYPDLKKHPVIQKPKTCSPCLSKACKYQKCMWQIEANEVFEKIKEMGIL